MHTYILKKTYFSLGPGLALGHRLPMSPRTLARPKAYTMHVMVRVTPMYGRETVINNTTYWIQDDGKGVKGQEAGAGPFRNDYDDRESFDISSSLPFPSSYKKRKYSEARSFFGKETPQNKFPLSFLHII